MLNNSQQIKEIHEKKVNKLPVIAFLLGVPAGVVSSFLINGAILDFDNLNNALEGIMIPEVSAIGRTPGRTWPCNRTAYCLTYYGAYSEGNCYSVDCDCDCDCSDDDDANAP